MDMCVYGYKIIVRGAGEMVKWLRALFNLPKDLGSIPSTHIITSSSPRGSKVLFWLLRALGIHEVHRHTCR